ncbi:hypothetical protein [Rhodopirellula islandica]|uniref:hypothetical protein n=1 Tax=Rhodopirellula islandica TaxID=595434 RepID=UPI00123792D2|nr:hypothetical protein [Rhodopirellula islandica]
MTPLFDHGQHARATKAQAFIVVKPKQQARKQLALILLRKAGRRGLTREQWAEVLNLKVQSICSIALELLRDGLAVENGGRRKTSSGSSAAVIVAAEFAGSDDQ